MTESKSSLFINLVNSNPILKRVVVNPSLWTFNRKETSIFHRKLDWQKQQGKKDITVLSTLSDWQVISGNCSKEATQQWRFSLIDAVEKQHKVNTLLLCKSFPVSNCLVSSPGFVCTDITKRSPVLPLERLDHVSKLKLYEMMTNIMNSGNRFYRGYYSSENLQQDKFLYIYCTWWTKCLWFWL